MEKNLNDSLNNINEQPLDKKTIGKKIRIGFIGEKGVGKSTLLNNMIGQEIFPTGKKDFLNKLIILRNKDINNYDFYEVQLKSKKENNDKYYYFEENIHTCIKEAPNIKSYLNKIINDEINKESSYFLISGKLAILNCFLKLDDGLMNEVEFLNLDIDRVKQNLLYKKSLKICDCFVFILEPKTIYNNSKSKIIEKYLIDIKDILSNNKQKKIIFLINKSDTLNIKDKKKLSKELINSHLDKENIYFYTSGKLLKDIKNIHYNYIYLFDKNPYYLIKLLYNEWAIKI